MVAEIVALSSRYGIVTPYTSFLVREPSLALGQEGRVELGGALQATPAAGAVGGQRGAGPASRRCQVVTAVARRRWRRRSPKKR